MLTIRKGDLFKTPAQAWVNCVNTTGAMGAGIAKEFKKRFPEMYYDYRRKCQDGFRIGEIHTWKTKTLVPEYVLNFPTKTDWKLPTKPEYVLHGLEALTVVTKVLDLSSVVLPALGTGLGGLPFEVTKQMVVEIHDRHWKHLEVTLLEPVTDFTPVGEVIGSLTLRGR